MKKIGFIGLGIMGKPAVLKSMFVLKTLKF